MRGKDGEAPWSRRGGGRPLSNRPEGFRDEAFFWRSVSREERGGVLARFGLLLFGWFPPTERLPSTSAAPAALNFSLDLPLDLPLDFASFWLFW